MDMNLCEEVRVADNNGEYEINPGPETEIDGACKLFVLGTSEQIRALNRMIKHAQHKS